ncbi:MAG: hypothetical protein AAF696_18045 [Bacteroidota bacterium]
MNTFKLLSLIFLPLLLQACSTYKEVPGQTALDQIPRRQETITQSLFDSKDRTISEADIQRLLSGTIKLPDTIRIAVYKYASTSTRRYYSYYWSNEDYLKSQQEFQETLVKELETSSRVQKVILVPTIMIDPSPNITQLRESAVRLQADLLLVYALNSDIYYKNRAFSKDEAKAFATCETLLMDSRTGVIPHSGIVSRDKIVTKAQEDWTNDELRKRAENGAISLALGEAAKKARIFLDEAD